VCVCWLHFDVRRLGTYGRDRGSNSDCDCGSTARHAKQNRWKWRKRDVNNVSFFSSVLLFCGFLCFKVH